MKQMFTVSDAEKFDIKKVHELYNEYINPGQVSQISKFGFGNELVLSAQGIDITLKSGGVIKDFTGGIGVLNHGHNHPRIMTARKKYSQSLGMEVHKNFFNPFLAALSANMNEIFEGHLSKTYLCNSGAEAVEGALKMAYKGKFKKESELVLSSDISFHGKLFASGGLSNSPEVSFKWPKPFDQIITKYGNIDDLKNVIDKYHSKIFAFIIEPFNASSLRECSDDYLKKARDLCSKHNIILIFDEVYTGWFKTGPIFNFMRVPGLYPDIVTTSKSFGGGKASTAAYIANEDIFSRAYGSLKDSIIHSTTYNGFGEESVTVLESMNICFDDGYQERIKNISKIFREELESISNDYNNYIGEYSGAGALWGLVFKENSINSVTKLTLKSVGSVVMSDPRFVSKLIVSSIINEMFKSHGYLLFFGSNYRNPLILSVPINIDIIEINKFFIALRKVLDIGINKLVIKFLKNTLV